MAKLTEPQRRVRGGPVIMIVTTEAGESYDVWAEVLDAYRELRSKPQGWVRLARLRELLGYLDWGDVCGVLVETVRTGRVHLSPDSSRRTLTAADHEAAVRVGGEDHHLLAIETD